MKPHFRSLLCFLAVAFAAIPVPTRAQSASQEHLRLHTVVIDPGHGGKDAGCISRDKKTYEKNITLDIGKRLSQKISAAYKDVTVKMTRSNDTFVELENRAVIANKANANLFISIHVNSVERGTAANGYSIHVLGQSQRAGNDLYSKNLDLVKRENSVIMLEDNYQTKYQGFDPNDPQSSIIFSLMQNAHLTASLTFADDVARAMSAKPVIKHNRGVSQDPFWVLWRTAMPAVLIEVGFMTNPDDLATMRSEKGREGIAENIFQAFKTFKARYDGSMTVEEKPAAVQPDAQPAKEESMPQVKKETGTLYGIQILASAKPMPQGDPFFHGYKPMEVKAGKYYKYVVCTDTSLKKVRASYSRVQTVFKDAYLVKIVDGTTAPIH